LKNNGDGTFQLDSNYAAGDIPTSVFCANLDGDSALDLAVANYSTDNVSVLMNNGDGTFQAKVDYYSGYGPTSVFCADLDGDSALYIAVANIAGDEVSILENNGDGTFPIRVNHGVGDGPRSVFCADLDGDSDLDLAVANSYSDSVSILINQTITTDVEDSEDVDQLPERCSLSQNYPNPFNQSTQIEFTLAKSDFVSLNIYDLLGRKVRTLVSERLSSGYKSVLWDGRDNFGNDVASGVYFYQLRVGDFSETKNLVLLK
jgi:ankyrin repeat protein